jgi:hypothetical protein
MIPFKWNLEGSVTAVLLATSEEKEYVLVLRAGMLNRLAPLMRKRVRVTGHLLESHTKRQQIRVLKISSCHQRCRHLSARFTGPGRAGDDPVR